MNLAEYQKRAITTAIYEKSIALPYIALGLVSEVGELIEKLQELIEGNYDDEVAHKNLILKEIGDIYWYSAAWAEEVDCNLTLIKKMSEGYGKSTDNITVQAAKVADVVKKALRDDFELAKNGEITQDKANKASMAVSKILSWLDALCKDMGFKVENALEANIQKLESRKNRNVIKGSGDLR